MATLSFIQSALTLVLLSITVVHGEVTMPPLIPQPVKMEPAEGRFTLTPRTQLIGPETAVPVMRCLREALAPATGFTLPIQSAPQSKYPGIVFAIKPELAGELGKEGYRLTVTSENVIIEAVENNGLFYASQTIRQLLPTAIFQTREVRNLEWTIPCVTITDYPRFQWRGMHLDVCRHFMPKEFVKKYIDLIALHKMNVFHWHLTDDQGWRIEIKKYPRLTDVGAWRKETILGHARGNRSNWRFDGTPHGGWYTQEDVREIVAYAAERFVTVVPEIEMPGHAQAAIAAYPELGTTGKAVDVLTYWGGCEEIFNVEESTLTFLQDVLLEVLELFPSKFIHIGGDEVTKQPWKDDPRAQSRIKALGVKDEDELQSWFIRQMDAFLAECGRRLVGWDEILEGGLAPGATVMSWRGETGGIAAANAGHDVVMTPGTHTYFDKYQADPETELLAIGGFIPLEKVYAYEPIPSDVAPGKAKHVLGAQGQIWTEYIPTSDRVEYMAYPRACALAEVVWTPAGQKDFSDFKTRLAEHLKRLDMLCVNYRPLD
jgi:hexosaminidase